MEKTKVLFSVKIVKWRVFFKMLVCPICGEETNYLNLHLKNTHKLSIEEIKEVWKKIPKRKNLDYDLLRRVF